MTIDDQSSIYVGGLGYNVSEDKMRETFEKYGEIVAVKIVQDQDGNSRGYGFVTFTKPEDASNAIFEMDGKDVGGRKIRVNEVRKRVFRDHMDRDRRDRDWRDRDYRDTRIGRDRGHGGRYNRRRSPFRGGRDYSPYNRRSSRDERSRSRSGSQSSRDSFERYDEGLKTRGENKLKEDMAKLLERQKERRDQVANLENDLKRAAQALTDVQSKHQKLEGALVTARTAVSLYTEHLRKMQRVRMNMNELKEKLVSLEKEYDALMEAGQTMVDASDTSREERLLPNGDIGRYVDENKNAQVEKL